MLVLAVVTIVMVLSTLFFAFTERSWARQSRRTLSLAQPPAEVRRAFEATISARNTFARAAAAAEAAATSNAATSNGGTSHGCEHSELVARSDEAKREALRRLEEAQNHWASLRAEHAPDDGRWLGFGITTTWSLGVISLERAFLRLDHTCDETSWAILEARRVRWGFGVGWERQRLAAVADNADMGQLTQLVGDAFSDADVAIRPGFSPRRVLRSMRRSGAERRAAEELMSVATIGDLSTGARYAVDAAARRLDESHAPWADEGESTLDLDLSGPSLLLGAWAPARARVDVVVSWPERLTAQWPASAQGSAVVAVEGAGVREAALG